MNKASRLAVLASSLTLAPMLAHAGPPLLCFPMETGGAPSLPWAGAGWNEPRADYDRSRLATDVTALLTTGTPVLARMETLRRAVLYARTDATSGAGLLAALRERAARAGEPAKQALARFDLGYAIEAARQARSAPGGSATLDGHSTGEDGYALVQQALVARPDDVELQYAAALMSASRASRAESDAYLRRALAGARPGSSLALTIRAHRAIWGGRVEAYLASAR